MTVDSHTKAGSRYGDGPITVVPSHTKKKTTRGIITTTILGWPIRTKQNKKKRHKMYSIWRSQTESGSDKECTYLNI